MAEFRVAILGSTGRGDYGHGLDSIWQKFSNCEVVAVADPDEPIPGSPSPVGLSSWERWHSADYVDGVRGRLTAGKIAAIQSKLGTGSRQAGRREHKVDLGR